MKNTGEKLAILLLCLALLIGMIPVVSQPVAAAAGITEVSDMETFKALMSQDGDVSIKLTAHLFEQHGYVKSEIPGGDLPLWAKIGFPWMMAIDHELPCYYGPNGQYVSGPSGKNKDDYEYKMPYWLILGSGSKRIDLQGFSIVVDYPNVYENISTMFLINEGTSLTINDSTGDSGYIHYEGYIFDIEEYDINNFYYATNMYRGLFEVSGGSLTINGGTLEAGRSKKQWVTNAHTKDEYGTTDWYSSYTGNVTKSVNGNAVTVNSGSLTINGGTLLGRGEYRAVINANGGSVRIAEGRIDARGSANCLRISSKANVELVSGVFLLHKNDVVYEGRAQYTETNPYLIHYGTAGQLGFTKENINYDQISVSFMDPRPPRHWMVPNSIVEGDGFDLWNEIVAPYGYETFMIVKPVSHEADINFMAAPGKFQPTINTDSIVVKTNYTCVFQDVATVRARPLYATNFYDVYDFDTMTLLGHAVTNINKEYDLCEVIPGLRDKLEEGKTYAVFATVIEQYEGAYPYEVRSVACNLFNATSYKPITITKQPDTVRYVAGRKGGEVTLTAEAANATDAYWEMIDPYYEKLDATTFQNGRATLTVPVDFEATYRCQFTNPYYYSEVHDSYTYIPTNKAEVAYLPAFELRPGQTKSSTAFAGHDTEILLWHNGQEDTGGYFYGNDYGQAGMYAWYKDGVKLDFQAENPDGTKHYSAAAYWGGGLGLKIRNVTEADAGQYECICGLEEAPFGSGKVDLEVLASAGWIYQLDLTGLSDLYVGDLPPAVSSVRINDNRASVKDVTWTNLDEGGHITPQSYYTVTLEAKYGASFDELMTWSTDGYYADTAIVSADGKTAELVDVHKYEDRGDYEEEDDTVVLSQTSFTLYQGLYVPLGDQFKVKKLDCPSAHTSVLGYDHEISNVEVLDSYNIPDGLHITRNGFWGQILADPGIYKVPLHYTIADAVTGKEHNGCDVVITFTVLSGEDYTDLDLDHMHAFGNWKSDGRSTHSAACETCGEKAVFPHEWDEGFVIKSPTKSSDGTIVYTCAVCGQTLKETLSYEDYMPPFPEVREVTISGDAVIVYLEEYSGYALDTMLAVAVYDSEGRFLGIAYASPDKSGKFNVTLPMKEAGILRVFVLEEENATPKTAVYEEKLD